MLDGKFRKSSHSFSNGNCVEAAGRLGMVAVRDSKDPGPRLRFSPAAWERFTAAVRAGRVPGAVERS
jgi:hypothetical protein